MYKLSTIKFHCFSRSMRSVLVVSRSYIIKNQTLLCSSYFHRPMKVVSRAR